MYPNLPLKYIRNKRNLGHTQGVHHVKNEGRCSAAFFRVTMTKKSIYFNSAIRISQKHDAIVNCRVAEEYSFMFNE